ncbi:MAG: SMC-Scp complex subunit ScpB [Deltaproteobacteria bacterium RBG_13_43_22]|jgi:segregation and condensation protein B|nr:MAG: SMC-Scp complex subunit ScpB [Deltaproteobacteria bacterium RBG_13_43_22]
MNEIKSLLEALIFVSPTPIGLKKILEVVEDSFPKKDIESALSQLLKDYETPERGLYIQEVAEGFQFRTKPRFSEWIKRLKKISPARLSKAALETLAIIAYKQPATRGEVERLRGVEVDGIVRALLEKNLIRIVGRKEIPGRPILYGTTQRFLELFELKNLSSLPSLEEIKALSTDLSEDETE